MTGGNATRVRLAPAVEPWFIASCLFTMCIFALIGLTQRSEFGQQPAEKAYYNQLVAGFRAGQLHLPQAPPTGLLALPDPHDPDANALFRGSAYTGGSRLHDLSLHGEKLYLYFGPSPALLLFWPFSAVTGKSLSHQAAVVLFACVSFLAQTVLLRSIRRRFFPGGSEAVFIAGVIALGLGNGVPMALSRAEVWEVAVFCGQAMVSLALLAVWRSLISPGESGRWLALAGLFFGFSIGARPSLLPSAVVLLAPCLQAGLAPRRRVSLAAAALLPVAMAGALLLAYNHLRFGSLWEFGQTHQLAGDRQDRAHFSASHLAFNLYVYFLAPASWTGTFPWIRWPASVAPPPGHAGVEPMFGLFTNLPFVWVLVSLPLVWRGRRDANQSTVKTMLKAVLGFFAAALAVLACFYGATARYQIEMTSWLVLGAAITCMLIERQGSFGRVQRPWLVPLFLGLSIASAALNLLGASGLRAFHLHHEAGAWIAAGNANEAISQLRKAVQFDRGRPEIHDQLALLLSREPGGETEAAEHFRRALELDPARPGTLNNLGLLFAAQPERQLEAIELFERALRLLPAHPIIHLNLGLRLAEIPSRQAEAVRHFSEALRLDPSLQPAREALRRLTGRNP